MNFRGLYKKLLLLILFLLLCGFGFFAYERRQYNLVTKKELETVRKRLRALNTQEKQDLAFFFKYAVLYCQYPYTLVGYKPMSICNYLQESDDLPPVLRADYERSEHRNFADALERGYRVWEKYATLFPQKNYLIIRYHASNSKGMNEVALIHSQLCLNEIETHLNDFCRILQMSYRTEEVFEILTHPDHQKFYQITQNHRLLGVLLGFGRNNAYLFEHKEMSKLRDFTREWPTWPRKWRLPCFICDQTTDETKRLKKSYKEARKFIRWTYFNRNDLEVTLSLLGKEGQIY